MKKSANNRDYDVVDGFAKIDFDGWEDFSAFLVEDLHRFPNFIWRGQQCEDWDLLASWDRKIRELGKSETRDMHAERFRVAIRSRRGPNPPELIWHHEENWALGQHHGLWTPLLDWTESPFAAAFFAFMDPDLAKAQTARRAVWGLAELEVSSKNLYIESVNKDLGRIELRRPNTDENPRLVAQAGLFTSAKEKMDVETWVRGACKDENQKPVLIKLTIPNKEREKSLRSLNTMNINHLALFPDLYGSTQYCNMKLEFDGY